MKDLNAVFIEALSTVKGYEQAKEIAIANSTGNIYLIGGIISRLLVQKLYRVQQDTFDIDFVCDQVVYPLIIPDGWVVTNKKFGNPTFKKGEEEIDIWPLSSHEYIQENKLEPTIENLLKSVPFTIQAVVFDIKHQRLIGDIGVQAIKERTFAVNNLKTARALAKRKGITIDKRMHQKAKTMGLKVLESGE